MFKSFRIMILMSCSFLNHGVFAWGSNGHMVVGTIADQLIAGTAAATQVRKILGSNLRTASVWADCSKGVSPQSFTYSGDGRFPECAIYENPASKKQMIEFVRRNVGNCTSTYNSEDCHKQYHYTDVAIQRAAYVKGQVGTSDQDVVAAITAMIAVLQGNEVPEPFKISGKKEALRLLSHYVGDIHQPLHVAAVYLDSTGQVVDPDEGSFDPNSETRGGNDLLLGKKKLHAEWDSVTGSMNADGVSADVLAEAGAVPLTPGALAEWSTAWATESLLLGKDAFDGISYSDEDEAHHYQVKLPAGYSKFKAQAQRDQVIRGGARLGHILMAIWP